MGKRYQFKDKILWQKVSDIRASNTDNATVNAQSFDSENALAFGVVVDVHSLGSGKSISIGLADSTDNSNFSIVPKNQTNADIDFEIESAGVHNIAYYAPKRYFRVAIVSRSASPASTIRIYYWRQILHSEPDNLAFI